MTQHTGDNPQDKAEECKDDESSEYESFEDEIVEGFPANDDVKLHSFS